MNDATAVDQCALQRLIDSLPSGYVAIGDAAYTASSKLVPIYYGVNREQPLYDNFNYFASQLRIRIEMAFGLMQNKWRILLSPRQVTPNLPYYIMSIAYLHNYVITYRESHPSEDDNFVLEVQREVPVRPSQPVNQSGEQMLYDDNGNSDRNINPIRGHSVVREQMALHIQSMGLTRRVETGNYKSRIINVQF